MNHFVQFLRDEQAQDLVEYSLVAALIALGAITAMSAFASAITNAFSAVASNLSASGN
jgi:pilus assembly protein Flp/PilA